jgi:hypothetical protein
MKRVLLLLSALLLLTGCANSQSLVDQAGLIEYEACLGKQEKLQQEALQIITKNFYDWEEQVETILKTGLPDESTGLITSLETMKKNCIQYRP